jgi:biopolymer transport protein ExbD
MAGSSGSDDDDGINEINVTPLVDIMLVLLIIFMVASTYIVKPSIEVELPKAATGGDTLDSTLSLVLTKTGEYYLNGEPTTREAIAAKCKEVSARDDKAQAIIAADDAALHGQVVGLIDLIRQNGVLKFAINIKPQDEP